MEFNRRIFLKASGLLTTSLCMSPFPRLTPPAILPKTRSGKTLVVVFLRGGIDGLNLIVPHGDPHYGALRPNIAIPEPGKSNGCIDIDGMFGLHPAAISLSPYFESGVAKALLAVGHSQNSRSHFEEQDMWETAQSGNSLKSDGWLNRHLATSEGHGPIRAVAIGDSLPRILRGPESALAIRGLGDLAMSPEDQELGPMWKALDSAYAKSKSSLNRGGRAALDAVKELRAIAQQDYVPRKSFPNTNLGRSCREVARLVKANVGIEVLEVELGGWDTHQNQGGSNGAFAARVRELADAMSALAHELEDRLDDVLILTLSEFGRTARQNGTGGTDHGWGNGLLVMGGKLTEKSDTKVLGQWPGLAPEALHQRRDLESTTDFRDVLAEVVHSHLGNPNIDRVFPQHARKSFDLL